MSLLRKLPPRAFDRLIMMGSVQRVLGAIGRDLSPERWIFVIGCYNSGTTLLASILRNHPLIGGLRTEGGYLTDSLPYPEQFGWPRMWCRCLDDIRIEPGHGGEERAQRIKRQWSMWFPRDTPNLVEKTVSNAARIPFLQAYFKPAYFIYIVRNGYAVAGGIQRNANYRRWNCSYERYPIELCAEQWRVADETIEQDRNGTDHILQIYYEDLAANPNDVMRTITDFLGVSPMPKEILNRGWAVHGIKSAIKNMNPKSLRQLSEEDVNKIKQVAGSTLAKHGYASPLKNPL